MAKRIARQGLKENLRIPDFLSEDKGFDKRLVREFSDIPSFNFSQKAITGSALLLLVILIAFSLNGFSGSPVFVFLQDTLQSTMVFLVIAMIAVGLNLLVHKLSKLDVDKWIIFVIKGEIAKCCVFNL